MNKIPRIFLLFTGSIIFLVTHQSCNTLYNVRTVKIEIAVPARVKLPEKYDRVAVKYNNSNVSSNPNFANYTEGKIVLTDTMNIDSIASEVYFEMFVQTLRNQFSFDSIVILEPTYYSGVTFTDTISQPESDVDTLQNDNFYLSKTAVKSLKNMFNLFPVENKSKLKNIDPDYGLYTKEEIEQIEDSTGAGLLLSFDYYAAIDGIQYNIESHIGIETVLNASFWTVYNLRDKKLMYFYDKVDTVYWNTQQISNVLPDNFKSVKSILPPRIDAVLNAADISGTRFAELLVPHWVEVERMYYHSGHLELKKTDELLKNNKWLEAAKIWRKNVNNKNKSIAAKSMFNMALACEIEGDIDAAIDWVVKSFHVFEKKNELHYFNCLDYLQILGQRKVDIKVINNQLSPENSEVNIKENE